MDRSSGFGLMPTCPPSRHDCLTTVASWAFVPVTAAGQRGFFTPLPNIHLHYEYSYRRDLVQSAVCVKFIDNEIFSSFRLIGSILHG